MLKPNVVKKNSPQHQILHQNLSQGYSALFRIISHQHPTLGKYPRLLIQSPPVQLAAEAIAQYYQHNNDFIATPAFLEENQNSLNKASELGKFLSGLTYSTKIFLISRKERHSNDPHIKWKFTQGAIVNTSTQYFNEMNLDDGLSYSFSTLYDDSDSDFDSDLPTKSSPSCFAGLKGSVRTLSLQRSGTSLNKKKKKKKVKRANQIQVNLNDPLALLVIPNDLENHLLSRLNMY